jgi:hypothetical protein
MNVNTLTTLVRTLAHLRSPQASDAVDTLDPALVQLLLELLEPTPVAANQTVKRKTSAAQPGTANFSATTTPTQTQARPASPHPDLPDRTTSESTVDRPRTPSHGAQKLVGLPASLVPVIERADLKPPERQTSPTGATGSVASTEAPATHAPMDSLFPAGRVRAILRDMATVASPSGELDTHRVVAQLARGDAITALPQRHRRTLSPSIGLLFDVGPTMLPFSRDKQQLGATALRLLGKDRVRIADFIGSPSQGVRAQRRVRWEALRWPVRGATLVVVSDLGIGAPHLSDAEHDWAAWLREARGRGIRTLALIPYEASRWPAVAQGFDLAMSWDLSTGVQAVRRLMRQHR